VYLEMVGYLDLHVVPRRAADVQVVPRGAILADQPTRYLLTKIHDFQTFLMGCAFPHLEAYWVAWLQDARRLDRASTNLSSGACIIQQQSGELPCL
jgi:hypothetical protein